MRALVVIVLLVAAALACGCGAARRPHPAISVADRRLSSEARPVLAGEFHVPSGAEDLAVSDGALWVSGYGAVSRLDPVTGRVVARISTPGLAVSSRIAIGERSIWVASGPTVYRIDPSTDRVVAAIHVGGTVVGIAVGPGRVWVTRPRQGAGQVIRIDPRTNRVAGHPIEVGRGPSQISYGEGAVWVENTAPPSVMRIDPATGNVSAVPAVGVTAIGYDSLWAASEGSLRRFDPGTGRILASLRIPRAQQIAIGAGEVWILASPRSSSPTVFDPIKHTAALWEVDPRNNQIIGKAISLDAVQPIALAVTSANVWVADYRTETVARLHLGGGHAGTSVRPASRVRRSEDVLDGNGIAKVTFGQTSTIVTAELERLFGRPASASTASAAGYVRSICGFDHEIDWVGLHVRPSGRQRLFRAALIVYFKRSHFVGYAYQDDQYISPGAPGSETNFPLTSPAATQVLHGPRLTLATAQGLAPGDPLARARRLYGRAFTETTQPQGTPPNRRLDRLPAWRADSASGRIQGAIYTTSGFYSSPQRSIGSIDAGAIPNTPCR
jgi:hypothetical protein